MTNCEADIWRPRTECDNIFDGVDPTLINTEAAIIIGSEDPSVNPHTAEGPTLSQAKANATTAAKKLINTLGGNVDIGGPNSLVQAWNLVTAALERVLTISDRFYDINPAQVTGTAYIVKPGDVGLKTEVTNPALVTLTIDSSSANGVEIGQEAIFFISGVGITQVVATGGQTLISPAATAAGVGRSISLTYIASNTWLYTGP